MKEKPFEWYHFVGDKDKVLMDDTKTTGLLIIPGCQQDEKYPTGVLFGGKRRRTYSIDPFGAVILGNKGTYRQELSREKLFPDTDQPVIVPFGEFLQVHSCDDSVGVWSFLADDKWVVSWNKVQRVNNPTANRFDEFFQLVYDYTKEEFSVNFGLAEAGESTFVGTMVDGLVTGGLLPKYESLEKKSFLLFSPLDEVVEPPLVIKPDPDKPAPPPFGPRPPVEDLVVIEPDPNADPSNVWTYVTDYNFDGYQYRLTRRKI